MGVHELQEELRKVEERIAQACARAGRGREEVMLLPVTKRQPIDAIRALYDLGFREFGESRVQELLKKRDELPQDIRWHLIGNLQSNKVRYIAPFLHTVHSVHTIEVGKELSKRAAQAGRTIRVLVEVNISNEAQKHGASPEDAETLILQLASSCPNLEIAGLMGMASFEEDSERTRPQFRLLRELRDQIAERHRDLKSFTELSMGMSNDYEVAIEEGATIVRVGSALFGERVN